MDSTNMGSQNTTAGDDSLLASYTPDEIVNTDILKLLGAENMPPEKKEEVYQKMMQTIENRVFVRIDEQLDDAGAAEFKTYLEKNDRAGLENFLKSKNIDLTQLFSQETLIYKMQLVDLLPKKTEE